MNQDTALLLAQLVNSKLRGPSKQKSYCPDNEVTLTNEQRRHAKHSGVRLQNCQNPQLV